MPYLPKDRQYRDFSISNFEPLVEVDDDDVSDGETYVVRGHYTVFNTEYELFPGYYESIAPTALDETDTSDVLFQFNHAGTPLARLRNKSLRIGIDEVGGWAEADLSGCQQGRDTYEAIKNGLIDRMSFGFTIADDGFEWDMDDDGNVHSRITKVEKLFDVSCVDLPANEATDISARSYLAAAIEARRKMEDAILEGDVEKPSADKPAEDKPADEPAEESTDETIEQPTEEQLRARRMRRARAMRLSSI